MGATPGQDATAPSSTGAEFPAPSFRAMAPLLLAALLMRVFFVFVGPFFIRPDEVFQALEPAHRLLTGHGAITWEWHEGIRSWLLPGIIAVLMEASALAGFGHSIQFVQCVFASLSLVVVVTASRLGQALAGRRGAMFCGVLVAFWPDTVLDGAHTLSETTGGNLLAVGTMLASLSGHRPATAFRSPLVVGLLLGFAVILRFQLLPGVAVVLAAAFALDRGARSRLMLLGVAVPVAGQAVLDTLTLGTPLQSMWKNLLVNLGDNRSDLFGTMSPVFYVSWLVQLWGAALLPATACFVAGFRAASLAGLVVIAVVLSHSLIAHKEFTFIAGAIPLILVVSGVGAARLVGTFETETNRRHRGLSLPGWVVAGIVGLSLTTVFSGYKPLRRAHANLPRLMRDARHTPDLCGVALYVGDEPWWDWTGGYSVLDRDVPLYLLRSPADLGEASSGFNALLAAEATLGYLPPDDAVTECIGGICLLHRAGSCASNRHHLMQDARGLGLPLRPGSLR